MTKIQRVDGLTIKSGPTESGEIPPPNSVGGEMMPINKLAVFLSQFWFIVIIILIPLAVIFYKKQGWFIKIFNPLLSRYLRM